ncbi:hypothetical protein NE237_022222 [Protea cynaroides]|uniref:Hydroxyproline-rich glycoprotein family protein n=1 Tax=Protea cynaroides TaxID=273540 RepID=A0A9Q0K5L3_9MAGN|nr:hypothetical protein NE237_022222 [Protea cynaroides]
MAGNGGGSNGTSISAAATAVGSVVTMFPQPERRRRWGGCWGGLSCFGSEKGGRRIVPRPEGNTSINQENGPPPVGLTHQPTTITASLLAPPSSPASFTNSAHPSTPQSPSCFLSLSANSPDGPSSTMFAMGPYAHETQLVSPPVFSNFTTEPSTAPLTPPPELAHLTPPSPDVPFAQFLSSSAGIKNAGKSKYAVANDLQATYPLYPGIPMSSPTVSRTSGDGMLSSYPEQELSAQWGSSISNQDSQYSQNRSSRLFGLGTATSKDFMLAQDSSFFCPATSAQFYLDQAQQSLPSSHHNGGKQPLSMGMEVYSSGGNGQQNRHNKNCKPDAEEIEAYRASFGFSADEIITTPQYVEISDVMDDSFTMTPFTSSNKPFMEESMGPELPNGQAAQTDLLNYKVLKLVSENASMVAHGEVHGNLCHGSTDNKPWNQSQDVPEQNEPSDYTLTDGEDIFSKIGDSKISKRYRVGVSSSDAEIDYRRARSSREVKGNFACCD